jgi:hypothetical protein
MFGVDTTIKDKIKAGSKIVARKTYNQLIEVLTVLKITNPLFTDDEVFEKTDFITQACVYEICDLMGWDREVDYFDIFEAVFDELAFDELLERMGGN